MKRYYAGLDIGGTKSACVILTDDYAVAAEHIVKTVPGPHAVVTTSVSAVRAALATLGVAPDAVTALGVGLPGRVDPDSGTVHTAVNLEIGELAVAKEMSDRLGIPVAVENDVKAAALGASVLLRGRGDLSYLNLGTGVAAATVSGGELVRGVGNEAGEIGHLPLDPAGIRCECGQNGCLEVTIGGRYVSQRLSAAGLGLGSLADDAAAGIPGAAEELEILVQGTATAVQLLALSHGSPAILLGGGVVGACPDLVGLVQARLRERANTVPFLADLDLASRVAAIPSDQSIAAIGAAEVGRRAVSPSPVAAS